MSSRRRVAIKVDCDTFQGTKEGIPNLLRVFDAVGIRASFFFTLGPDNSGRALRRVFTQKGFLRKMIRSRAVSMYGPRTILYGTILPAPQIGRLLADTIRSVEEAGHEVGVHGWDHVHWHDHLGRMSREEAESQYRAAHEAFERIFGRRARASAAPGWHSTPISLGIQDGYGLLYSSNTRLGPPHFPDADGTAFHTLEIPTTLPTWDEALVEPGLRDRRKLLDFYGTLIHGTEVHTIHTEVEGTAHLAGFEALLRRWKSDGIEFLALENHATEVLSEPGRVPRRRLIRLAIPNRGGLVSSTVPVDQRVVAP